jgi:hypothetical protein
MYCNEAIMFFKHNNLITHKYITYYLKFTVLEQSKKLANGNIGNGSLNIESIKKLLILVPSIEDQEKIIKDIEKIESEQSSYVEYAKLIQVQIDSLNQLVKNITENNDNEPILDNESVLDDYNNEKDDILEKEIDSQEEGNYYSIDSNGKKDCLCQTDANGKIKKHKNIIIKEHVTTMLASTSGRIKKNC